MADDSVPVPEKKKKAKREPNFEHEIVKVFKTERIDGKNRFDLRIVHWKSSSKRTLEKRRIWEKDGENRFRNMAGLTVEDVQLIVDNAGEILNLLREG